MLLIILESVNYMAIKVIAFDVFGTVFDLSSVPHEEVREYAHHIHLPEWEPLVLPEHWKTLPAHADSAEGISLLRSKYTVVTASNGPVNLLAALSKHNGISWDMLIPIEMNKVYKPKHAAYMTICELMKVEPAEVMMVTANKTFGDLEAAAELGMVGKWIRGDSGVSTIIDLAKELGC